MSDNASEGGIAIVGMSGRFPQAKNVDEFWTAIMEGRDCVTHFGRDDLEITPSVEADASYVCAKGILDDVDMFDARFFGYLPRDAEVMDPQHRIFLEICWEAMEHAGYDSARYDGSVGVYGGCYMDTYLLHNLCSDDVFRQRLVESIQVGTLQTELGNDKDYLATRVAFKLGLRGPAMTLQTACSTSLVAIATACQALDTYGCDMALAGGITLVVPQYKGYTYKEGSMLSPDGVCRPFDADAAGTVFSNGAAVLLLKRVEDAVADGDTIYAVVRGYATNNDGSGKVSYTAPSVDGQAEVISVALGMAGFNARTMGYVEAHGTATPLGDPIEVAGLSKAFRIDTDDTQYCALGSVKANLGHLDVASGAIGLIKTALCVHNSIIPATAHFKQANPNIDLAASPFFVPTESSVWKGNNGVRRAGVSSFGVGGTNAHVVVEQRPPMSPVVLDERPQLLVFSGRTDKAVTQQAQNIASAIQAEPTVSLADIAHTLQIGRREFTKRASFVVSEANRAQDCIRLAKAKTITSADQSNPGVIFMFPGQATQYPGMARDLYNAWPVYRTVIDQVVDAAIERNTNISKLKEIILWTDGMSNLSKAEAVAALTSTEMAQPAIFATEIALVKLFESWGIRPRAIIGHSVGEIAAAVTAGVMSLVDAAALAVERGRLMQAMPTGGMIAVRADVDCTTGFLCSGAVIAAVNSPGITVVSGSFEALTAVRAAATASGVGVVELDTSHAFHSPMMDSARSPLESIVSNFEVHSSSIKIFSTLRGNSIDRADMAKPHYWGEQLLSPVLFMDAVEAAYADNPGAIFLELGPGQVLSNMVHQIIDDADVRVQATQGIARDSEGDHVSTLSALGFLWANGIRPNWAKVQLDSRRRVPLPTYPFERERHWIEPTFVQSKVSEKVSGDQHGIETLIRGQLDIVSAQIDLLTRDNVNENEGQ